MRLVGHDSLHAIDSSPLLIIIVVIYTLKAGDIFQCDLIVSPDFLLNYLSIRFVFLSTSPYSSS